jgi:hypothetical protein
MAAASTVRRAVSRVRATKTPVADDDNSDASDSAAKAKRRTSKAGGALKKKTTTKTKATAPASVDAVAEPEIAAASTKTIANPRAGASPKAKSKPIAAKPRSLVQRVYNTIDSELTKLEKQKGLTSQDRERASRALSQMVNALEKAVEMQRDITKTKSSGGDARNKEALAHAEDLRREIADRLERLNRKRSAGRRSE